MNKGLKIAAGVTTATLLFFAAKGLLKKKKAKEEAMRYTEGEGPNATRIYNAFNWGPFNIVSQYTVNSKTILDTAVQVKNYADLTEKYRIIYDRNLDADLQNGLSIENYNAFLTIVQGNSKKTDNQKNDTKTFAKILLFTRRTPVFTSKEKLPYLNNSYGIPALEIGENKKLIFAETTGNKIQKGTPVKKTYIEFVAYSNFLKKEKCIFYALQSNVKEVDKNDTQAKQYPEYKIPTSFFKL